MNLKTLSDEQLLTQTSSVVDSENRITASVIKHLFEINRRKLYLTLGYGSLFEMLRLHYRYCEPTAQLRKNAVYLMQDVPEVIEKIESGAMPVSVAANIQSFLYSEKRLDRAYSPEARLELVETCTGMSVRAAQREFVRRNPEIEKRESVRPTSEDRLRVSHSLSNQLEEKLQRIKMLWSHVDPNMSREQMLDRMADITLEQIDPLLKAKRAEWRKEKACAATPAKAMYNAAPSNKADQQQNASSEQTIVSQLIQTDRNEKTLRTSEVKPVRPNEVSVIQAFELKTNRRIEPNENQPRPLKPSRAIEAKANHELSSEMAGAVVISLVQ